MHTSNLDVQALNNPAPRFLQSQNVAREVSMSSSEIADLTRKLHKNVIRDIREMLDELKKDGSDVSHVREDLDSRGYTSNLHLDRELTELLLTGYSVPLRLKVIRRLNELEAQNRKSVALPSYAEALRLYADQIEQTQRVTHERDQAVATKAEIGARREATAMATASAAVKRARQLEDELGRNSLHATIISVEKATGNSFGKQGFRPLQKWCKSRSITPQKVPCPRYGEAAAWPAAAWVDCYGISLVDLFGGAV